MHLSYGWEISGDLFDKEGEEGDPSMKKVRVKVSNEFVHTFDKKGEFE